MPGMTLKRRKLCRDVAAKGWWCPSTMVGNAPLRIGYAALELGGDRERREEKHEARGGVPIKRNPKKNVYRKTSPLAAKEGIVAVNHDDRRSTARLALLEKSCRAAGALGVVLNVWKKKFPRFLNRKG